ncbi:uncharacterized protein MKK02DRAFT_33072 [Dioszegia hungarica]|uniref:Uncharacterized protein n=1 Tax=Dioszegia hungarica TaxID=4972 RepID=A0AA38H7D1_9TREE|nr:uncharacterized protein MKK02DRAFT_33072 [Dioszegia hungarica]KAI9635710.1 hypothetical protein MKK02DRAFT_33072 [Dioszegia hungarica]
MKRPTSAFLADSTEELDNGSQFSPSPPPTPSPATKKAKKSPVSPTKSAGPSSKGKKVEPQSPKGKLLAYFLKTGLKAVDKAEAERLICNSGWMDQVARNVADVMQTGLKPAQQRELMREDGKGALYNALIKLAEDIK